MTTPYRCRDRGSLSATSASFHCTVVVRLGAPAKRKILTYGLATVFHVVTSRVLWRQGARNWAVGDTLTPISRHVGQRSRNYPVWIGYGLSPEGSELNQKPWDLNISSRFGERCGSDAIACLFFDMNSPPHRPCVSRLTPTNPR